MQYPTPSVPRPQTSCHPAWMVVNFGDELTWLADTMAHDFSLSPASPFFHSPIAQRSSGPAIRRAEGNNTAAVKRVLPFVIACHWHPLFSNGSRKNGFVLTVSTRALKDASRSSLSVLFHQYGTRPHRISTSSR